MLWTILGLFLFLGGSINFEWDNGYKELELETDGNQILYLKVEKTGNSVEWIYEEGYLQFEDKDFNIKFQDFFDWLEERNSE